MRTKTFRFMLILGGVLAFACIIFSISAVSAGDLVAAYSLDEGAGNAVKDSTGNGNDGVIHGAKWVKVAGGHALQFDGIDDFVQCNMSGIQGPVTMTAWVCPLGKQPAREPGIAGSGYAGFQLTYYSDSQLYWYYGHAGTTNFANGTLMPGSWSHLAATFDGTILKIYVNGMLSGQSVSRVTEIPALDSFFIGAVMGDPKSRDAFLRSSGTFKGVVDEVKVFNRALTADEIAGQFDPGEIEARNAMFATKFVPVKPAVQIRKGNVSVAVSEGGELQVNNGRSSLVLKSGFSYPGIRVGWNRLSNSDRSLWQPRVARVNASTISVRAADPRYVLDRMVALRNGRVEIEDTLTNLTGAPLGILVDHGIVSREIMSGIRFGNSASCPMIYFAQKNGDFGIVAEDDIGRMQFDAVCIANTAGIRHQNFGLAPGKSYTFRYAVYPLKRTGDVYDFVNSLRRDWKVNYTVEGPWEFLDLIDPKLDDLGTLKNYLDRKNLKIVALTPFLDYDPGKMDRVISREEYKARAQEVVRKVKGVRPDIKVIGSIETDYVAIFPEKIKDGHLIVNGSGEEIKRVIMESDLPFKDSLRPDINGHLEIEYYTRGGKPQYALNVYPTSTNYQRKFRVEQAEFLMDEVGLDGIYVDDFTQERRRDYSKWDGHTVDIDPNTGRIIRKYTNCGLVGIPTRVEIMDVAIKRGKIVTTNGYPTSTPEQPLRAMHFSETQSLVNVDALSPGRKPPFVYDVFESVTTTPVGLGLTASKGESDLAQDLMLGVIAYLRHGALMYYYAYPDLPETGPGSGEYGPIRHMFPITPVELREGWIKGRERIISARSMETDWDKPSQPKVLVFDLRGRQVSSEGKAEITGKPGRWRVKLKLNDWNETAVVE